MISGTLSLVKRPYSSENQAHSSPLAKRMCPKTDPPLCRPRLQQVVFTSLQLSASAKDVVIDN